MLNSIVNAIALLVDGVLVGGSLALAFAFVRLSSALRQREPSRASAAQRSAGVLIVVAVVLAALTQVPGVTVTSMFIAGVAMGLALGLAAFAIGRARGGPGQPGPGAGRLLGPIATAIMLFSIGGGVAFADALPRLSTASPTLTTGPTAVPPTQTATPAPSPPTATPRFAVAVKVSSGGSVMSIPGDLINCPPTCTAAVGAGTQLVLHAVPTASTILRGWDGAAGCRTAPDCTFAVTGPATITATFGRPVLTVTPIGPGSGEVLSAPRGIQCPATCTAEFDRGTAITLRAASDFGSTFGAWSGACLGSNLCAFTLDSDAKVGASFPYLTATGYDASACGGSAQLTLKPGQTASLSACFVNLGTVAWVRGTSSQVNLAVCCPLNVASPLASWNSGWLSSIAYATTTAQLVAPGQQATFAYAITVPASTKPGQYTFNGELVLASTGAPLHILNYSQTVTVL